MIKQGANAKPKKASLRLKSKSHGALKRLTSSDGKRTSRVDEISDGIMLAPMIIPRYSMGHIRFTENRVLGEIFDQKMCIRKHLSSLKYRLNSLNHLDTEINK